MRDEIFFDTNILVYAFDKSNETKRRKCAKLVGEVMAGMIAGCVSNQVLTEFYSVMTTKTRAMVSKEEVATLIDTISESEKWKKISYDHKTVVRAAYTANKFGMSIWDALVVETMKENGLSKIFTEDEDFSKVPGMRTLNPLRK